MIRNIFTENQPLVFELRVLKSFIGMLVGANGELLLNSLITDAALLLKPSAVKQGFSEDTDEPQTGLKEHTFTL